MPKKKIGVLISGNGSNLQALIDACKHPDYPCEITTVISNKAEAYGINRASQAGIPAHVIDHKDYPAREAFDEEIEHRLLQHNVEIVCLAGFMRLLSPGFVERWAGRMLNIHPSLLPKFKGAHAIADAFNAGEKVTGCTVHYVVPEMDSGEIILQAEVAILPTDTEESLAERIHAQEHKIYPQALRLVAQKLAD